MSDSRAPTRSPAVFRASAVLAIAGGGLRLADSFTTGVLSARALALLYFVTDVCLLAGIAGIWWWRRRTLGHAGTAGVVIFIAGTLAIRVSALGLLGSGGYQVGATIALLGLAAYSVETLLRSGAAPWAPVLWLAALASGIVAVLGVAPLTLTMAAGVAFGAAFIAAGVDMLHHQSVAHPGEGDRVHGPSPPGPGCRRSWPRPAASSYSRPAFTAAARETPTTEARTAMKIFVTGHPGPSAAVPSIGSFERGTR